MAATNRIIACSSADIHLINTSWFQVKAGKVKKLPTDSLQK